VARVAAMLKLLRLAMVGAVVNMTILAGLYLPGAPAGPVFWLVLPVGFATFAPVLYLANGRRLGNLSLTDVFELLRELPVSARILLGLVLAGTLAQMVFGNFGVITELGFKRTFASVGVWITVCSAALAYALRRRGSRRVRTHLVVPAPVGGQQLSQCFRGLP
jgi:hypothetical protein